MLTMCLGPCRPAAAGATDEQKIPRVCLKDMKRNCVSKGKSNAIKNPSRVTRLVNMALKLTVNLICD